MIHRHGKWFGRTYVDQRYSYRYWFQKYCFRKKFWKSLKNESHEINFLYRNIAHDQNFLSLPFIGILTGKVSKYYKIYPKLKISYRPAENLRKPLFNGRDSLDFMTYSGVYKRKYPQCLVEYVGPEFLKSGYQNIFMNLIKGK